MPAYNYDHDPSHGYGSDDAAYAVMAWSHPTHHRNIGQADTESWSQADALRLMIDTARSAEVTKQHESARARNGVIIRRLLFAGLLVLVALACAVGTDAAIRAGVGDLNHAPAIVRLVPAHVACVVHAARKC